MSYMFGVRSSPRGLLPIYGRALSCTLRAPRPPAARCHQARTLHRTVCPPFDSWQEATAFNQPLTFDTSSVTDMQYMFRVRSARALAPGLQSDPPCVHAACATPPPHTPSPPSGPHLARYHMLPMFDPAGGVGIQSAAEL